MRTCVKCKREMDWHLEVQPSVNNYESCRKCSSDAYCASPEGKVTAAAYVLEVLIDQGKKAKAPLSEYERGCLQGYRFALSLIAEPAEKEKSA